MEPKDISHHCFSTSFLIVLPLLGASMRNSAQGKGHEEGGFGMRKGGIKPQEIPCSRASTPQTRVPTLLFYALTYTSDFTGG